MPLDQQLSKRLESKTVRQSIIASLARDFNLTPILAEAYFTQVSNYFLRHVELNLSSGQLQYLAVDEREPASKPIALCQKVPVRLPELADGVLQMMEGRLRAQAISFRTSFRDAGEVFADPDQLRRAMVNLVGNAVDAMPNGGTLTVSVGSRDDGGRSVVVEDTGVGIPPGDRERIFEPYFTTKASGLGLGLVLTKKIIDAHGGRIAVESEPGKGTRIEVSLPVGPPAGEARG